MILIFLAPKENMSIESIKIFKVNPGTQMSAQLLDFVKDFSWVEVREHTIHQIENWNFSEWETPFVAIADDRIIGMATIMKSDYYPLPDIFPWISTIFVSEAYRGHRISGQLIDYANRYAKKLGFIKTYIPSEHKGLYEKYGYTYLWDIVNYDGGIDRLYMKEIVE